MPEPTRSGDSHSLPGVVAMLAPAARLGIRLVGHAPARTAPITDLVADVLSFSVHAGSCRNARHALDEMHRAHSVPTPWPPAERPSVRRGRSAG